MAGDAELLHLSLARRDYLRHPLLLSEILALHALLRITSGPPRRAVARAIAELKVAVCDRQARMKMRTALGRGPHWLNIGRGEGFRDRPRDVLRRDSGGAVTPCAARRSGRPTRRAARARASPVQRGETERERSE